MEISKLPLHKKTTIVAEKFMIAVLDRISQNTALISYRKLETKNEVLKILQKKDGRNVLQFLDTNYWKIYSDG